MSDWQDKAPCKGLTDLFFVDRGEDTVPAKAVCAKCECRLECLQLALDNNELYGIFGGLTRKERLAYRRGDHDGTVHIVRSGRRPQAIEEEVA